MGKAHMEIKKFHDNDVKLSETKRKELKSQANTNRGRIQSGLASAGHTTPMGFRTQGSYAMRTLVNRANNDYDIDDGVYFVGDKISNITPLALQRRIRDAIASEKTFSTPPEIKEKCVRVFYADGHHIDVPAYKMVGDNALLASSVEWVESDPKSVTDWFDAYRSQDPNIRFIVRLIKELCGKKPSGLIISVLAIESLPLSGSDYDDMFHNAMKRIKIRLDSNHTVKHPVIEGEYLARNGDSRIKIFHEKLATALHELKVLEFGNCSKRDVLHAWGKVFCTTFFANFDDGGGGGSSSGDNGRVYITPRKPWLPN